MDLILRFRVFCLITLSVTPYYVLAHHLSALHAWYWVVLGVVLLFVELLLLGICCALLLTWFARDREVNFYGGLFKVFINFFYEIDVNIDGAMRSLGALAKFWHYLILLPIFTIVLTVVALLDLPLRFFFYGKWTVKGVALP